MASTIDLLGEKVNKVLKNGADTKDISKEDFRNFMGITLSSLKALLESFGDLQQSECEALGLSMLEKQRDRAAMNVQIYFLYQSRLSGQAQRDERKSPFSSLITAAKNYQTVLDEIDKNIDKMFENKVISLYNTKLSHIAIVGVIKTPVISAISAGTSSMVSAMTSAWESKNRPNTVSPT